MVSLKSTLVFVFVYSKIAFTANRKNMVQHIVLFGWALDDNENEAAMMEILDDAWCPRIDSQGTHWILVVQGTQVI